MAFAGQQISVILIITEMNCDVAHFWSLEICKIIAKQNQNSALTAKQQKKLDCQCCREFPAK